MRIQLKRESLLRTAIAVLLATGVALFATAAVAGNVDYEDKPLGAVPPSTPLVFDHPLYVQVVGDSEITDGVACAPNCPGNGSKYHLNHESGFTGLVTISGEPIPVSCDPECSPFDLFKIDLAEPYLGSGPVTVTFTGFLAAGGSVDFQFVSDGIADGNGGEPDFETVVLPDTFRNLASVSIIDAAPYISFAIDNIVVEPEIQPAPALAPFSLGALALVLFASAIWLGRARVGAR